MSIDNKNSILQEITLYSPPEASRIINKMIVPKILNVIFIYPEMSIVNVRCVLFDSEKTHRYWISCITLYS